MMNRRRCGCLRTEGRHDRRGGGGRSCARTLVEGGRYLPERGLWSGDVHGVSTSAALAAATHLRSVRVYRCWGKLVGPAVALHMIRPMRRIRVTSPEQVALDASANAVAGAARVLAGLAEHHNWNCVQGSPAEAEAAEAIAYDLDPVLLPTTWRAVIEFSSAAVEHGEALAVLLRSGHTLTVPMIGRSVIELAQAACWLLEPTHDGVGTADARVTAVQRAARGQLAELFSLRHCRDTLQKLTKTSPNDSSTRDALFGVRRELTGFRARVVEVFGEGTVVDGEPSSWRIAAETLPGLTSASEWFFKTMTLSRGLGIYDTLSGYVHPTLWALREHHRAEPTVDGGVDLAWTVGPEFMARVCATTASTLYRMLCQMAGYFGWDESGVHQWAEDLNEWYPDLIQG